MSGGAPIAEVDLRTFTVAYHEPRRRLAMLARLRNSFEPQAAAKGEVEGPQRTALWLPGGTVAVTGFDGNGQRRSTPAGLTLVNTRSWKQQTIDRRATSITFADGVLFAFGCCYATGDHGVGLTAYAPTGQRLWHLFGNSSVYAVEAAGGRVYSLLTDQPAGPCRKHVCVHIADARRGTFVRRVQTPWAALVSPSVQGGP